MAEHVKIEDARAIARAAMATQGSARRQDAPIVASAFTFPDAAESELTDTLISVDRVMTGERSQRFEFDALVVVGDHKGTVGFGRGSAGVERDAIRKATDAAKDDLVFIPLQDGHALSGTWRGRHGAGNVLLRSAKPGTGIVANEPVRAILQALGVNDIVAESTGSTDGYDLVRATFDALRQGYPADDEPRPDDQGSTSHLKAR